MGIIDSFYFRLTCPQCGKQDTAAAHDRGSNWSGSSWGLIGQPDGFAISQSMGLSGPKLESAQCTTCKVDATWEEASFSKPKEW